MISGASFLRLRFFVAHVKEYNTTFAYDGNGNITRAGDKVFNYDSVIKDRLVSVDGKAITYSESNPLNPKTYDGKTFEFEGRRLVKVSFGNMVATYQYDDTGLRTEKTVTKNGVATTTKFMYNGGKLIAEYTGTKRVDYLYDENGMLYGFIYNNAKYFYIRDTLQNILGIVDANSNAVVHYNYTAYGECKAITGSKASTIGTINSFRYKGYYLDNETGCFYCRSRFYLPQWYRWLNCDNPARLSFENINVNLHTYCENNPIMNIDASGFKAEWLGVVFGVAFVAAAIVLTVCSMVTMTGVAIGAALATGAVTGGIGGALSAVSTGGDVGQGIITGTLVGATGAINPLAGGLMAAGMSLANDRLNNEDFNVKSFSKSVVSGMTACAFSYASSSLTKSMMPTNCDVLTEWVANGLSNFIFASHNFVADTIIAKFVNW